MPVPEWFFIVLERIFSFQVPVGKNGMMHPIVFFEILIVFFFQFEVFLYLQTILEEDSFAILQMDYGPGSFAFSLSQPLTVNFFFLKGFNDQFPVFIIANDS